MKLGLEGKVVFVSGGSRGIGLAIARGFLGVGASVAITCRNLAGLEEARAALAAEFAGSRLIAIAADMTDEAAIARALDRTEKDLGPIHAAVANAGTGQSVSGFALSRADWSASLEANLMPGVLLAGAVLPRLTARRAGSLTFISSIAGLESLGAPIPYAVAKAGLQAAMSSYARLVGPDGVRVNAVAPGNVLFPGGTWKKKITEQEESVKAMIRDQVPLDRFASPVEIADMVLFLASDRASFITGATMVVDGGQTRSF